MAVEHRVRGSVTGPPHDERENRRGAPSGRRGWEWVRSVLAAFVLFLMIRTFLVEAFRIPTGSMENTLLVGDFLLVNKAISGSRVPFTRLRLPAFDSSRRGDVAFVQRDAMRRKHLFVHYSFEPGSHTPPSWLTGTRWRRTGERVHGPAET